MDRRVRESIMNQGVVKPETPRERRLREKLHEDVRESPLAGGRIEQRLRNFKPSPDSYIAALGGPLPYMTRLRSIHLETLQHERQLVEARREVAEETGGDEALFGRRWRETAARWNFSEVNELIARHNRWFPAESRLPMDPKTGDYALVNGEHYTRPLLDADWILERFPPLLERMAAV
jgi:hypothetical protein